VEVSGQFQSRGPG